MSPQDSFASVRISSAVLVCVATLLFSWGPKAAEASFGSGDNWHYGGEVAETPLRGKFCTYIDSRLACAQGRGGVGTDGGEIYQGEFVNGEPEGYGEYENDLYSYVGSFKHGRFKGYGELTCSFSNRQFRGVFADGKLTGQADSTMRTEPAPSSSTGAVILWPKDDALWLKLCSQSQ
jgi:hypothetical protein